MIIPTNYLNILMDFTLNYLNDGYKELDGTMNNVLYILESALEAEKKYNKHEIFESLDSKLNDFKLEVIENQAMTKQSIENFIISTSETVDPILTTDRLKRQIPLAADAFQFIYGTAKHSDFKNLNEQVSQINLQALGIINKINSLLIHINVTKQYWSTIATQFDLFRMSNTKYKLEQLISHYRILYFIQLIGFNLEINKLNTLFSNIQNHKLTHQLISPNRLLEILQSFEQGGINTAELKLIYDLNSKSIHKFYNSAKVYQQNVKENEIRLLINIPLISINSSFDIYKITPLSHFISDSKLAAHFDLQHNFVAISTDRKFYFPLDQNDLAHCEKADRLICPITKAILNIKVTSCPLAILQNNTFLINKLCKLSMRKQTTAEFTRLPHDVTSWAYSSKDEILAVIYCPELKIIQNYKIKGTGLLTLKDGCILTSTNYFLYPLNTHTMHLANNKVKIVLQNIISHTTFQSDLNNILFKYNITITEILNNIENNYIDNGEINLHDLINDLEKSRLEIYLSEVQYWLFKFQSTFKIIGIILLAFLGCFLEKKFKICGMIMGCYSVTAAVFRCCFAKRNPQRANAPATQAETNQ